jgi:predicted aspartyl protease
VKFYGSIQHKPVTLLVDSGSSSSFVSSSLAANLSGVVSLGSDIKVQVAGGGILISSQVIPQALWFIGDIAFQSDLRVLPMSSYDMILGMDWLEQHSPMRVHWRQKWLDIPYGDQTVSLPGVPPSTP